jgi:cytosine/uracil/thiamine/allantoin permease
VSGTFVKTSQDCVLAFRGPQSAVVESGNGQRRPAGRILRLVLLVLITLAGWAALVLTAVDIGRRARAGDSDAWTSFWAAAAGAVLCLVVAVVLGARLLGVVRGTTPARRPRTAGRRMSR